MRSISAVRRAFAGLAVVTLGLAAAPAAFATSASGLPPMPTELRKYVPTSPEWAESPWMRAPACKDRGGDFSLWTTSVLADAPTLLAHFQPATFGPGIGPADRARSDAIVSGYVALAADVKASVPNDLCVDDIKAWTGPDAKMKPFGFAWGVAADGNHQSMFGCHDDPGQTRAASYNEFIGAERVLCDGVYLSCANASAENRPRCENWNGMSDRFVRQVDALRTAAINAHPATGHTTSTSTPQRGWVTWTAFALAVALILLVAWCGTRRRRPTRSPGARP